MSIVSPFMTRQLSLAIFYLPLPVLSRFLPPFPTLQPYSACVSLFLSINLHSITATHFLSISPSSNSSTSHLTNGAVKNTAEKEKKEGEANKLYWGRGRKLSGREACGNGGGEMLRAENRQKEGSRMTKWRRIDRSEEVQQRIEEQINLKWIGSKVEWEL